MTCLVFKIDYFQVWSMVHSIFNFVMSWEKKATVILSRSSSRVLGNQKYILGRS